MQLDDTDYLKLQKLEEQLWQAATRFDMDFMEQVLAVDFFEFGMSGRAYQRRETLAIAYQPIDAVIPLPDFHVRLLAANVAHVTYRSVVKQADGWVHAHRSSIWSRSNAGWILKFHQGTQTSAS